MADDNVDNCFQPFINFNSDLEYFVLDVVNAGLQTKINVLTSIQNAMLDDSKTNPNWGILKY